LFDDTVLNPVDQCCECDRFCGLGKSIAYVALGILALTLMLLAKRQWKLLPVGRLPSSV